MTNSLDVSVETVARAICAANHEDPDKTIGGHLSSFNAAPIWMLYKSDAEAAIAVTRTPSAEMTRALVEALEESLGWILDTDDEGAEDWGVVHKIRAALSLYRSNSHDQ